MIEMTQFLKWLGRKMFGGVLDWIAAIPGIYRNIRNSLREDTGSSLFLWIVCIIGVIVVVAIVTAMFGVPREQALHCMGFTCIAGAGLLLIVGIQALYDAFKEDQRELLETLKRKH